MNRVTQINSDHFSKGTIFFLCFSFISSLYIFIFSRSLFWFFSLRDLVVFGLIQFFHNDNKKNTTKREWCRISAISKWKIQHIFRARRWRKQERINKKKRKNKRPKRKKQQPRHQPHFLTSGDSHKNQVHGKWLNLGRRDGSFLLFSFLFLN